MEVVRLRFLKKWRWHEKDEVIVAPPGFTLVARKLIKDGVAERYIPKKIEAETKKLG
jgi:hypothetical protein